jgi:N utilization substance protein B
MLNRRFLRIKVMQFLFAYSRNENPDRQLIEKELFKSLSKIYELYIYVLALLKDLYHLSEAAAEDSKSRRIPAKEDLVTNEILVNNTILRAISESKELEEEIRKRKISWQNETDMVRRLSKEVRKHTLFKKYLSGSEESFPEPFQKDRQLVIDIIVDFLNRNENLNSFFEEKYLHWADDTFVAYNSVIRNLEDFQGTFQLLPLLKDEDDDIRFMTELFNKTLIHESEYEETINRITRNWEVERIANMDILLLKMALTEILHMPNIPLKVTLNEYIEISKQYSSPASRVFVNGVLDKLIRRLKAQGLVQKTGRGLDEGKKVNNTP